MRYFVNLDPENPNDVPLQVDVQELPSGILEVRVDGKPVAVDVADLGAQLSVRIDGKVVDLTTEGTPPDLGAVASGHRSYVRVQSERFRAAEAARKTKGGGSELLVKSPMPGRVVKVMVAVGDEVAPGQALFVVEAMKMENEVKAKTTGRVAEVMVVAGATVEANAKMLRFEG